MNKRIMYTFKLLPDLLEELKIEAKNENRSLNNYVESLLISNPKRLKGIIIKNATRKIIN